jgi:hypothetical protein
MLYFRVSRLTESMGSRHMSSQVGKCDELSQAVGLYSLSVETRA